MDNRLSNEDIENIADLIKIFIPEEQMDHYQDQLETALDYLDIFNELSTDEVMTTSSSVGIINVFRDDFSSKGLDLDDIAKNAHCMQNGFIQIQQVVRKN